MDRRNERGQATRQQIVGTATRLFTESGYEAVSIEDLLGVCGVSRGALYHHFESKQALFRAVVESAEGRVAEVVAEAARRATDPLEALRRGCKAWIDLAAGDPTIRRVVLVDAPAVLGWEAWREIDDRFGLGLLKVALSSFVADGVLQPDQLETYAHALLVVLTEMALMVARKPEISSAAALATVDLILGQLARRK